MASIQRDKPARKSSATSSDAPSASTRSESRSRRKARSNQQKVVVPEDSEPPISSFHVRISNVRAVLRVVEPRPVILSFEFDNHWFAETDIYSRDTEPQWQFNNASIRSRSNSLTRSSTLPSPPPPPPPQPPSPLSPVSCSAPATPFGPTSSRPLSTSATQNIAVSTATSPSKQAESSSPNRDANANSTNAEQLHPPKVSTPSAPFSHTARFVYETECGHKLHRKYMVVRLSERSPFGDVEWGFASVPIDSIARGCEQLDLSIMGVDGTQVYGQVYCTVTMVNVQKLRVDVSNLRLSDYPNDYKFDLKFLYMDLCVRPFENGFEVQTEKLSHEQPRFATQPSMTCFTSLRDMLISVASGGASLKVCISAHRQVAMDRTEEIGMGALPIRMLFAKVQDGVMKVPTKFKVPLANFKGNVDGKILLSNIPQFSQLPGVDLVNVDGVIMPADVDLSSRKLLPWVKLPRSMDTRSREVVPGRVAQFVDNVVEHGKQPSVHHHSHHYDHDPTYPLQYQRSSQYHHQHYQQKRTLYPHDHHHNQGASITTNLPSAPPPETLSTLPSTSSSRTPSARHLRQLSSGVQDEWSEASSYSGGQVPPNGASESQAYGHNYSPPHHGINYQHHHVQGHHRLHSSSGHNVTSSTNGAGVNVNALTARYEQWVEHERERENDKFGSGGPAGVGIRPVDHRVNQKCQDNSWKSGGSHHNDIPGLGSTDGETCSRKENTGVDQSNERPGNNPQHASNLPGNVGPGGDEPRLVANGTCKSGKSVGSSGTGGTIDGQVEIGSVVMSAGGSDDGTTATSQNAGYDVRCGESASTSIKSEGESDAYAEGDDARPPSDGQKNNGIGTFAGDGVEKCNGNVSSLRKREGKTDEKSGGGNVKEWVGIYHEPSKQYYFVHRATEESLWLPPNWDRAEDEDGQEVFIDHSTESRTRVFPVALAREYRDSVYTSTG